MPLAFPRAPAERVWRPWHPKRFFKGLLGRTIRVRKEATSSGRRAQVYENAPMTSDQDLKMLRPRIKELIVERLFIEGVEPASIDDEAPFMAELGLDSIDVLELLVGIEQEYSIKLVDTGLEREAFQSVRALADLVQQQIAARSLT